MPLAPSTATPPTSRSAPAALKPAQGSQASRTAPVRLDPDAVEAVALRAERRLNLWFDAVPSPSIEQLGVATQAIWRLAAVCKTLHFIRTGKPHKPTRPPNPFPPAMLKSLSELERLVAELDPPKPKRVPPPPSSMAPLPPLPSLPPLPPLDRLPWNLPGPPRKKAPKSPDTPPPVAACPELRNPANTAQAAERQAHKLCREAGLPDLDPTPQIPASDPQPQDAESQKLDAILQMLNTVLAPFDSFLKSQESGLKASTSRPPPT